MAAEKGFWNGLPTEVERGTAVVADAPAFPAYWARDLIGRRIEVVRVVLDGVNHGGGTSYLDNRDNSGWLKVTKGNGSPSYGHRDLDIAPGSFEPFEPRQETRGHDAGEPIFDELASPVAGTTPRLGDSLDLPLEAVPGGAEMHDVSDARVSGGVVVMATVTLRNAGAVQ